MKLLYNNIFSRCLDISDYEGGRINDAEGNSMFEVVHLTEQDKTLVGEYAKHIAARISEVIGYALEKTEYETDGIKFTFLSDAHLNTNDAEEAIEGSVVSYIMAQWLSNKSAERANAWNAIHADQMRLLPKSIKKKRPTLDTNY